MIYLFHMGISLTLIILQTTIISYFAIFGRFYDMLIPFVFFLGLFRPARESIPVILLLGFIQDNLSGGPFGIFLTTYFWLFVLTRWSTQFFHPCNKFLWVLAVTAGVLLENLIIIATIVGLEDPVRLPQTVLSSVVTQLIWAFFTGSVLVLIISYLHNRWDRWLNGIVAALKERET